MNEAEVLELLHEHGAIRSGHFLLSSGKHSDTYVEKARVFEHPRLVVRFGEAIASWYEDIEAVVSPAVGAIPLGFAVAMAVPARFLYAERVEGRMTLRRGFSLDAGERTVVVEDVVTTGGSAGEVHSLVSESGAAPLGVGAMVDRSAGDLPFALRALARVEAKVWDPEDCPLCELGSELEAPGSRQLGA